MEINGFPLAIPDQPGCCRISTKAVHYKPIINKKNGDRFYCLQCKDLFEIDPETGLPVTPSPGCRFHQLRPRKEPGRSNYFVVTMYLYSASHKYPELKLYKLKKEF